MLGVQVCATIPGLLAGFECDICKGLDVVIEKRAGLFVYMVTSVPYLQWSD
jgi:hypothetical protein